MEAPTPNDDTAVDSGTTSSGDGINPLSEARPPSASATATTGVIGSRSAAAVTLSSIAAASNHHASTIPGLSELLSQKTDTRTKAAKPSLPSMAKLSALISKKIHETPPYLVLSSSSTQMNIEDPKIVDAKDNKYHSSRKLVARSSQIGYRMCRASHGSSSGCFFYEAVVLGLRDETSPKRGQKRKLDNWIVCGRASSERREKNGHLRLGWSTQSASLEAPVGYDQHSYAVRDISGSRIHKSRREDKWGGHEFGAGDVIGCLICVHEVTTPGDDASESHIRFFKNGRAMGSNGTAFTGIAPGTYYPSISCFGSTAVYCNFGPKFLCEPEGLPAKLDPRPTSELCPHPFPPEEAAVRVLGSMREGDRKKQDDGIVSSFKELIGLEAKERLAAYTSHNRMYLKEIEEIRDILRDKTRQQKPPGASN